MFESPKRWFHQIGLHPRYFALLRNSGVIFGGNATSSIIALIYLGVLTRAISIEQFSLYSLYGAFIEIIGRLTSFQTWQGLIHYGSHAHEQNDKALLFNLACFGLILDVLAGVLGFVIAVLMAAWLPSLFGLPEDELLPAVVAATILLFNWSSMPTALLRIYDRFFPQALAQNLIAVLQLTAVTLLWLLGEKRLIVYLAVTSLNNIISQLWFFWYAVKLARKEEIIHWEYLDLAGLPHRCDGIWHYVVITNVDGVVRVVREIDIFIVNGLIDVRAVGLYKIAKTIISAMGKLINPFYQTIYPELARMVAARKTESMAQLMKQSSVTLGAVAGVVLVGFLIFGPMFLRVAFGAEYVEAYSLACWCIASMVVWAFAQPLSPAMMAMRKPGVSLAVHVFTVAFYLAILVLLIAELGLVGAGVAMFLFHVAWAIAMYFVTVWNLARI